ncbi:uncharacterized protein CCOS01_10536 [Colletotrichum costaricense]|uniref:Uncharacterized protein n=1 Tax=Colletotrichum costaricense TaxID=1209916 RepID=A0AAI9YRF2_9PEZI|nr:uncharacterized protein CCOS01_10536 [Colletotrichum costaricense]KAK1520417.1 hypothetical protein CCOS01_10536 [Colletotrichum costaricense]
MAPQKPLLPIAEARKGHPYSTFRARSTTTPPTTTISPVPPRPQSPPRGRPQATSRIPVATGSSVARTNSSSSSRRRVPRTSPPLAPLGSNSSSSRAAAAARPTTTTTATTTITNITTAAADPTTAPVSGSHTFLPLQSLGSGPCPAPAPAPAPTPALTSNPGHNPDDTTPPTNSQDKERAAEVPLWDMWLSVCVGLVPLVGSFRVAETEPEGPQRAGFQVLSVALVMSYALTGAVLLCRLDLCRHNSHDRL